MDAAFDAAGSIGKSTGGDGNVITNIVRGIGSLFGGKRATGGSVNAGKIYRVNENTPNSECLRRVCQGMIFPRVPTIQQPTSRPSQQTIVSQQTVKVSISLDGANGDAAVRSIARDEARRGVIEGLKSAEKNSPARDRRYNLLGT